MSFPTDIHGAEGEQWQSSAARAHMLGTKLVLQDGREFRYVENGGTLLVAGNVIQAEAPGANFDELVMAAAAVGATAVVVTTGSTAVSIDDFRDGAVFIEDDAGESFYYPLGSHGAVATTTAGTFTLRDGGTIQVALTAASTCLLVKSLYKDVIQFPTTATGAVVGVAVSAIAVNHFGWIQTNGPCGVLTDGTLVIGQHVRVSDGTAGAVEALDRDGSAEDEAEIGRVISLSATTEHSLIDLTIK
jgi:hypothetical protein